MREVRAGGTGGSRLPAQAGVTRGRASRRSTRALEPPSGFRYRPDLVDPDEERCLVEQIRVLPFEEFKFHGFVGRRRVVSFGWHYSFDDGKLRQAAEIPPFLLPVRDKAAAFADLPASELAHAMVTEYSPGTAIGWHRDRGVFGDVIGVSLSSSCVFRLRRKTESAWERYSLTVDPRSGYLLRGPARTEWEHSIPAVAALRYSITFRSLR